VTSDPDFKVTTFLKSNIRKTERLKDKVTIAQRKVYLTYGMVLFGDLDWLLNASRGFVSISWASCFSTRTPHFHVIRYRNHASYGWRCVTLRIFILGQCIALRIKIGTIMRMLSGSSWKSADYWTEVGWSADVCSVWDCDCEWQHSFVLNVDNVYCTVFLCISDRTVHCYIHVVCISWLLKLFCCRCKLPIFLLA